MLLVLTVNYDLFGFMTVGRKKIALLVHIPKVGFMFKVNKDK